MTTDFRALCAELLDCLEKADWPHKQKHVFEQWVYVARKALAEPEPEGPTPQPADGEVAELVAWLRKTSSAAFMDGWPNEESINIDRAADLLELLSTPQPS